MPWAGYNATFLGPNGKRDIWVLAQTKQAAGICAMLTIALLESQEAGRS